MTDRRLREGRHHRGVSALRSASQNTGVARGFLRATIGAKRTQPGGLAALSQLIIYENRHLCASGLGCGRAAHSVTYRLPISDSVRSAPMPRSEP
ncbi:hypothetical protein FMEAI12_2910010 [Parafrankia sp. Ea1.12]|nr:hypothetical protein FMEAI12_2910010 [Parafrankia sp. Ea1.12]